MARVLPHLDAAIYPLASPRTVTTYHGFGRVDAIKELYDRRDDIGTEGQTPENKPGSQILRVSKVTLDDTVAWPYGGLGADKTAEAALYIPHPFGQLKPVPLWDLTQTIDLNYWAPIGMWTGADGTNDHWNDQMELPGLPQPVLIMTNGSPLLEGEYTGLRSRFQVPWNAVMCFALWRADPPNAASSRSHTLSSSNPMVGYITVTGGGLPEVGQAITVTGSDSSTWSATVTAVNGTGIGPYYIYFTPEGTPTASSISWSETWSAPANYKYGTNFYFGITGTRSFCLEIPYGSDAVLWMRDQTYTGNQWQQLRPDRTTRLNTGNIFNQQITAGRDVKYKFIWVAQTANGVAVSTDGFVSNVGYWSTMVEPPGPENPTGVCLQVPQGTVEFRHNAGAWGFAWLPINHPEVITVDGPVARLPWNYDEYVTSSIPHRYPPRLFGTGRNPRDANGDRLLDNTTVAATNGEVYTRVPASGNGFEWRATMAVDVQSNTFDPPGEISEQQKNPTTSPITYTHAVAPELHSVRYWTWPGVKTNALGSGASMDVVSGELTWSMNEMGTVGNIVLPDVPEEDYPDGQQRDQFFTYWRPRFVVLNGRWLDAEQAVVEGTDSNLYTGLVAVPDVKQGGSYLTAQITDETVKAVEGVSDGRVPAFDNWKVKTAVEWVLDHIGIPFTSSDIDDTGLSLTSAKAGEDPLWYPEDGRSWKSFLEEICIFDYMATIWIDGDGYAHKGCYYCGGARSSDDTSVDWAPLHGLHGWQGDACEAVDVTDSGNAYGVNQFITLGASYKSSVPTGTPTALTHEGSDLYFYGHLIEEEYYNHCRVKGAKHMGADDPMSVEFTYWPSVTGHASTAYALGYKKTQAFNYEWASDYATLYRVGRGLYMRGLSAPVYAGVTLPFSPELAPRAVVGIYGAEVERRGVNGCRWRIVDLTHRMDRKLGIWRTELRCRYLGVIS